MKYLIKADIKINGTVQRKDIIGAIMGQTEGLLGDELELRKIATYSSCWTRRCRNGNEKA